MVANQSKFLSLPHPPHYSFHVCFTSQFLQTNFLDAVPGLGNGERTMFLDDVEENTSNSLGLLGLGFELYWRHLRLWLLRRHHSHRRSKHHLSFELYAVSLILVLKILFGNEI